MTAASLHGCAVVEFGPEGNRPGDATNAPGHDTEEVTSMPDKRTPYEAAVKQLVSAVESHLSAYSESDEMAESDAEMAAALARVKAAKP